MQFTRHFSLGFVVSAPAILSLVIVALILRNHIDTVNREIDDAYRWIETSLIRATKIITVLDYSFSNYSYPDSDLLSEHSKIINDNVCQMWPIDKSLLREDNHAENVPIDVKYLIVGEKELCDEQSYLYQRASEQVSIAPVLSFLHDIDDYLFGVHYIDKEGYLMSAPVTYAKGVNSELLATIKARSAWRETLQNGDVITLLGPKPLIGTSKRVFNMMMPVYVQGEHQGVLSLDISAETLLGNYSNLVTGSIRMVDTSVGEIPENSVHIKPIEIEGVHSNHSLYYELDLVKETRFFFYEERYNLAVILILYVLSVLTLFFINTRVERRHFKELAAKDPMTGLLNRRGLEEYISSATRSEYVALAVLDLDNFKLINDNYGHDMGDNVICYVADQIANSTRDSDAVARFGGEEFVIYLRGRDQDQLFATLERVRTIIGQESKRILDSGFTVSGGVVVTSYEESRDFDKLFKAADEKLYIAKTTGKDKLEC